MPIGRNVWFGVLISSFAAGLAAAGCGGGSSRPEDERSTRFQGLTLTVAAVAEPAILSTVSTQKGEWSANRGASITIRPAAIDLNAPASTDGVDVFVFPGQQLGALVDAGVLAVLPESMVQPPAVSRNEADAEEPSSDTAASAAGESGSGSESGQPADSLRFAEVAATYRDRVSKYGSDRMALPYGGTALVLVYDRGAFTRTENRAAAEKEGIALEPPRTWEQLDALARFFQGRDWDGDGSADFGLSAALGRDAERLGDAILLARAASLGQHRDQYSFLFQAETMAPRIDTPPFVEALAGLVRWKECVPPEAASPTSLSSFDADAARSAFRAGKTALLIDRAEMAARWSHARTAVGVAPLPGSDRVYEPVRKQWEAPDSASPSNHLAAGASRPLNDPSYLPYGGGWLVGVSRKLAGRQRDAALDLARYLAGPETAVRVRGDRLFPMLPVRPTLWSQGPPDLRGAIGVDARQWSDAVNRTLVRAAPGTWLAHSGRRRLPRRPGRGPARRTGRHSRARRLEIGRRRLVEADRFARQGTADLALPTQPQRAGHAARAPAPLSTRATWRLSSSWTTPTRRAPCRAWRPSCTSCSACSTFRPSRGGVRSSSTP